jgi:hypothetical protein
MPGVSRGPPDRGAALAAPRSSDQFLDLLTGYHITGSYSSPELELFVKNM